jgi:hypothetical protein
MAVRPEDIPRRQERMILADVSYKFCVLYIGRFFRDIDQMATFIDAAHVMRALWSAACRGQSLTAQQIGHTQHHTADALRAAQNGQEET